MQIKKALTFRASSIGDCLMGKYFLENIHAAYPNAKLGIVVASRGSMIRDLFSDTPWLEVVVANRSSWGALWDLFKEWNDSDVVLTQYARKPNGKFSLPSKIAARVLARRGRFLGFNDASKLNVFLYDKTIPIPPDAVPAELERMALKEAGIPLALPYPKLEAKDASAVRSRVGVSGKPYIVVHMFAGNKGRGISPEVQRKLIEALSNKLAHTHTILVSGGEADAQDVANAIKDMPAVSIAGKVSLPELAALIKEASLVVSVDTGVAHMAAQLGTKLIVLATCLGVHWWSKEQYGADVPQKLFTTIEPNGHVDGQLYPPCINNIDVEEVMQTIDEYQN